MKTNKTFRLFISSTFNDFREERKVLQTKVFPIIKKYCIEKGYRFQPIDLRWGINNEAQLDQKTLELCLEEVRACKSYPFPNFLVMLGDRYGWIPLPYTIEQKEFEKILNYTQPNEQKELLKWYTLDKNQLPASYVLKQREGAYTNADKWSETETILLHILQQSVQQTTFNKQQKQKYFTSATEAEIIEGIYNYKQPTSYQKKIASTNPEIKKYDADYTFGFIRNIPIATKKANKFIANKEDYDKSQKVKNKIKEVLSAKNRCEVITNQISEEAIETAYLVNFEKRVVEFLKNKLKEQIEKEISYTSLEIEQQEQAYFAKQKRKNFIGQETILGKIADYLTNDIQQAFVLYGKSGSGKSSIIAKAIEEAEKTHNVIYRFVGATSYSSSTTSLIKSIFNQLDISIKNETSFNSKNETFEEFSLRIKNKILSINNPVVIFIDAVDQLTHNDTFLWLPEILPSNVKIVISALNDPNYQQDSFYFRSLQKITKNVHLIEQFNNPQKLLLALLKKENRTLQKHQIEYFITQYKNSRTPLYVYIASQELKYWKSFDITPEQDALPNQKTQKLANSQKEIIQEFISNLSTFYHHDKNFVQKVLAYIYASKEGLSQNEILELINTDTHFIKQVAPETFHKNENKELPLVIWTRLFYQLKPFLNKKQQDNEELLFFFHREFIDVVKLSESMFVEHQKLINITQNLMFTFQSKGFDYNRFGKLFSHTFGLYIVNTNCIKKRDKIDENTIFKTQWIKNITSFNDEYLIKLINWNKQKYNKYTNKNYEYNLLSYILSKPNYEKQPIKYLDLFLDTKSQIIDYYLFIKSLDNALNLQVGVFNLVNKLYREGNNNLTEKYIDGFYNLGNIYGKYYRYKKESVYYLKYGLKELELLLIDEPEKWSKKYLLYLFSIAKSFERLQLKEEALELYERVLNISKNFYEKKPKIWGGLYAKNLKEVGLYYSNNPNKNELVVEYFTKSIKIFKELSDSSFDKWIDEYVDGLVILSDFYLKLKRWKERESIENILFFLIKDLYLKNPEKWISIYKKNLFVLGTIFERKGETEKSIEYFIEDLATLQNQYKKYLKVNPNTSVGYLLEELDKKTKRIVNILLIKKDERALYLVLNSFNVLKYLNTAYKVNMLSFLIKTINLFQGKNYVISFLEKLQNDGVEQWVVDLELANFYAYIEEYDRAISVVKTKLLTAPVTQPKSFYKDLARIENLRGNTEKCLEYIETYIKSDEQFSRIFLKDMSCFKNLRSNPKFQELIEEVKPEKKGTPNKPDNLTLKIIEDRIFSSKLYTQVRKNQLYDTFINSLFLEALKEKSKEEKEYFFNFMYTAPENSVIEDFLKKHFSKYYNQRELLHKEFTEELNLFITIELLRKNNITSKKNVQEFLKAPMNYLNNIYKNEGIIVSFELYFSMRNRIAEIKEKALNKLSKESLIRLKEENMLNEKNVLFINIVNYQYYIIDIINHLKLSKTKLLKYKFLKNF